MKDGKLVIVRPLEISAEQLLAILLGVPADRIGREALKRIQQEKEMKA